MEYWPAMPVYGPVPPVMVPEIRRLGFVYRSGELNADVQMDEIRRFALESRIELVPFDAQDEAAFAEAAGFLGARGVDAVVLAADTTVASASAEALVARLLSTVEAPPQGLDDAAGEAAARP